MDMMVTFVGGLLDGLTMKNDSADPTEQQMIGIAATVLGGCLNDVEKRGVPFDAGFTCTVPSKWIKEQAEHEQWSEENIKSLNIRHTYEFWKFDERDGVVEIFMRFKETTRI